MQVFGFFGYGVVLLVIACVAGALASDLRPSGTPQARRLRAIYLGVVAVSAVLGIACIGVELAASRETAHGTICRDNLKRLSLALYQYSEDWHDTLPPADRWMDVIDTAKYLPGPGREALFQCPSAPGPYGYAFNQSLSAVRLDDISEPPNTVLLFETDSGQRNARGSSANLARKRHFILNCSFADGDVHWVNLGVTRRWRWSP